MMDILENIYPWIDFNVFQVGLIFPALETSMQFQQSLDNSVLLPDYTLAQVGFVNVKT